MSLERSQAAIELDNGFFCFLWAKVWPTKLANSKAGSFPSRRLFNSVVRKQNAVLLPWHSEIDIAAGTSVGTLARYSSTVDAVAPTRLGECL